MIEMAYKYTYPVIDRALRNFLVFVLLLLAVVTIVAVMGATVGADTMAGDSLPMLYVGEDDSREEVDVATLNVVGDPDAPVMGFIDLELEPGEYILE